MSRCFCDTIVTSGVCCLLFISPALIAPIKPLTTSRPTPLRNWLNHQCVCQVVASIRCPDRPGQGSDSPSLTCDPGQVNALMC